MDVNLTISLMRGQMGVVIEKAVNAAVETVLGEMIRVVSVKFEEFRREMTAKERENENIRNMLEMSRCQMKSMRKYVNALTAKAKHDRQTFTNHRHTLTQFDASSTRHVGVSHARDVAPALGTQPRRTSANVGAACEAQSPVPKPRNAETGLADEPAWENQINVPKSQNVIQEPIPNESYTSPEIGNEDQVSKMHLGSVKAETANATVMGSRGLVAESSDPLWGQTPPSSSEVEHTDPLDSSLLPAANPREIFSTTAADCEGSPFKVKQEEAEVEIVQVKEEPAEVVNSSSSDCPRLELSQHAAEGGPSFSLELPVTQQCHQISCPPISEAAFMSVDPITCLHVTRKFKEFRTRGSNGENPLTNAEKTRRYRERINADPVRRAAMLEERRRRYREKKAQEGMASPNWPWPAASGRAVCGPRT
ncbi:uncharacterized protein si:ch211-67e16.4 isoform X5 [Electrophorus electricus]|uniref:uncharacterized protein si:ch211-67e16.4 isoform X5 n=1 Tax=Electrophorus electricus TaxID=8005 RepID=UPI0015D0C4C0|nr:uncharacterized protein si:ch211-67e16.4 isoform X5 [Electrophorus electricus]